MNPSPIQRIARRVFVQATKMIFDANHRPDQMEGDPKVGGHPAACSSCVHILTALHLVSAPLKLMYTETAVVVGLTHVFYPFMVLAIYSSLQTIDPAVVRAAQNLGASPRMAFWRVTLPLSVPGIVAGSLIVFALSVSSFVTPALLGGPWVKVVAYLAWEQNLVVLDWPFAAAISVILLVLTAFVMYAYSRLVERGWFAGVFQ